MPTMDPLDIDPNFEPQTRARSNTWPLPRPENFVEPDGDEKGALGGGPGAHLQGPLPGLDQAPKKNSSRRNAWGNMSYADLITQAIQSSPEKRLTLAQIYEWMVQNVAYFKDKGDSNSSAGWKNSIRHNLSLHNRFMRVQNEGTGKSSWWMINPDAKPGKAARRRATSMETQKYEKKRGRVKKKVEALRQSGATPSPSSSVSAEGQDLFPDSPSTVVHHGFQLSPDFRPRASSNASSCGGRLSPIPAVETDGMNDSDMPPLSPIPWSSESMVHIGGYEQQQQQQAPPPTANAMDRFATDHLAKSLNESMKLRNGDPDGSFGHLTDCAVKSLTNGRQPNGGYGGISYYGSNGAVSREYRPPAYQPQNSPDSLGILAKRHSPPHQQTQQQVIETVNGRSSYTLTRLQNISSHHHPMSPTTQLDGLSYMSLPYMDGMEPVIRGGSGTPQQQQQQQQQQPQLPTMFKEVKEERLSPLLTSCPASQQQHPAPSYHQHMMNHQQQQQQPSSLLNTANHVVGHLLYNALPQDLDLDPTLFNSGLECDVDQVLRHELSVEGNLDFSFENSSAAAAAASMNGASSNSQHHQSPITSTRSWVH